jgi:hypothetical protein
VEIRETDLHLDEVETLIPSRQAAMKANDPTDALRVRLIYLFIHTPIEAYKAYAGQKKTESCPRSRDATSWAPLILLLPRPPDKGKE